MLSRLTPGLIVLHGNQLEELREAVFQWLDDNPLPPLEPEIFLVQSNGIAEWLKITLAEKTGVCASSRVMLPARFLWECYRSVLGGDQVPRRSPFDKSPLTWRLMHLLPGLLQQEEFKPLRNFLSDGDPGRRFQLAGRLADLIDQYQVYRADWLEHWAQGGNQLLGADRKSVPLPPAQEWQPLLWRAVIESVLQHERGSSRADVHGKFVAALERQTVFSRGLPQRVVLFGISALPYQTLQALGALARHVQVLMAVPNPCQFYWGDIMDGRELLKAARRQPLRKNKDLAAIDLEQMHAHSHPLLASWGRMGRDFIRMLDEFGEDDGDQNKCHALRVDLFGSSDGSSLLSQVQAAIRDMRPLHEHPEKPYVEGDRSIEFHVAHSVQREVEILHDQLLQLLAANDGRPLKPRDIVVMVPDIEVFSPAIRAVFGQYQRNDPRHIPFQIADVTKRRNNPLLASLDWLLRLPQQRCLQSEVRDLLDVPAIAQRFGLNETDLLRLGQWIEGSGVRWGLDKEHRETIGLGAAGEQNTWLFGIKRMLLGYACGRANNLPDTQTDSDFSSIDPYPEIGGLEAALIGPLALVVDSLIKWRAVLAQAARPEQWVHQARELLADFCLPREEQDRLLVAELEQALQDWIDDCQLAGFDEEVPLSVFREAWLGAVDQPSLQQNFMSGGVTFCTLMPMRAVPFRVVCLLGMNDGDYPRRSQRADFDLLALPGMARPGDRSRRDDDRYLMLEALLASRDKLYISWTGRNVRDNSKQPPSVLVSQLRDYLKAGWGLALDHITTEHPLQPFSRRYFEGGPLFTYASEWRTAYVQGRTAAGMQPDGKQMAHDGTAAILRITTQSMADFLRQPVKYFFRNRLQVMFDQRKLAGQDEEMFGLKGLDRYHLASLLLEDDGTEPAMETEAATALRERCMRLARAGLLPIGPAGIHCQEQLVQDYMPARVAWLALCRRYAKKLERIHFSYPEQTESKVQLDDWLDRLRSDGSATVWLQLDPGKIVAGKPASSRSKSPPRLRSEKLIPAWLKQLTAAAAGTELTGYLVAEDAVIEMTPLDEKEAKQTLDGLLGYWLQGMERPMPVACKTAIALLTKGGRPEAVYEGDRERRGEADEDPCLARLWPDYGSLSGEPGWEDAAKALYQPLLHWIDAHVAVYPHPSLTTGQKAA